jgi:hypothetical protein
MAARITRPRAVKILGLIAEAREVIIQTHPEPEVVRAVYDSDWFMRLVYAEPEIIDPNGTIRFLHKIDELFAELGLEEGEPVTDLPDAESELSPGGEGSEAD